MMDDYGSPVVRAVNEKHPVVHLVEVQIHPDQEALKIVSGNHEPFSLGKWGLLGKRTGNLQLPALFWLTGSRPLRPPRRGGFACLPSPEEGERQLV